MFNLSSCAKFIERNDLWKIYLSESFRSFSISLLSLFVPLYLYKEMGYTFNQTIYFYILYAVVLAISSPLVAVFITRYGVRNTILLSIPFYLAYISSLYSLPFIPIPLYIISSLMGLSVSFYWIGLHTAFYCVSKSKHRGEEVGIRDGLSIGAATLGPVIGGFLIKYVGFKIVFLIATIFLFSSGMILRSYKERKMEYTFSLRNVVDRNTWKILLYFTSRGAIIMAEGVLWPIYLFVILQDYFSLGLLGTVLTGVSALLVWLSGRFSDHNGKRKIIFFGVVLSLLYWFLLPFVDSFQKALLIIAYGAIPYGMLHAPLGALEYDHVEKNVLHFFVVREIFFCLGRILILVLVLLIDNITGGFMIAGVMNFAALFL